jgi:hypothetical protein
LAFVDSKIVSSADTSTLRKKLKVQDERNVIKLMGNNLLRWARQQSDLSRAIVVCQWKWEHSYERLRRESLKNPWRIVE